MSYRIYRTETLVLKSFPHREADKTLALYTRDFGLIYARAQGIRHEKSKMRYALSDLAHAHVALVRGKAGWRVTGAVASSAAPREKRSLLAYARISSLVSRLVGGEEPNEYLFTTLLAARDALVRGDEAELIEVLSVSRMLHTLGYVAPEQSEISFFTNESAYDAPLLEKSRVVLPKLVARINSALSATQL